MPSKCDRLSSKMLIIIKITIIDDQDTDLSLAQATELLRVVSVRSQELKLPLVVAILDR